MASSSVVAPARVAAGVPDASLPASGRPLVSVVTGTWQRRERLLSNCLPQVRAQTYPNVEHLIVSEGPDPMLRDALLGAPGVRFVELGRNWTTFLTDSFGIAPWLVGSMLAAGEYHTWLADDDRMAPQHIEAMVDLLESTGADFVYGQTLLDHTPIGGAAFIIGGDPPQCGHIANVVHRAKLLDVSNWQFHEGMTSDWALVQRWLAAGATYAYLPAVTFYHAADH